MSQPGAESERWRNAVDFGADLLVADGAEEICGLSLLSASADAVMRAVNRLVSFDVRHCALVRWTVELYDVDDVTRDLTCAVTVGHVARDRNGWPLVPATVDYRACSRPIGRVTTRVLQHC
jgi:hypothetical protein